MQTRGTLPVAHDGQKKTMLHSKPVGRPRKAKSPNPGQVGGGSRKVDVPPGYAIRKLLAKSKALGQ